MAAGKKWWGEFSFEANEIKVWAVGKRKLSVQRRLKEWRIYNEATKVENACQVKVKNLKTTHAPQDAEISRFLYAQTHSQLIITAALADRPVIARPATKLNIPAGAKVELFVSTPLWIAIKHEGDESALFETPFWQPSDSWFGSNTMHGELCYAKYTDAKIDLALLETRAHRAITSVLIENEHDEPLSVTRLNIPVPFLNLYADSDQQFWSDQIVITHHSDTEKAGLKINYAPPQQIQGKAERISAPRIAKQGSYFVKSIKSLLG